MLHKIVKLESIGKFKSYQAAGDVAFNKITLIYSDNGGGKTTLTAVLRSLTQNDPDFIKRRKSINQTAAQSAQIIHRISNVNTTHTFNHTRGWNVNLPDIEIFDIHFINSNVYSGFDFNEEHKKQLHQFVIGDQGVQIRQLIEQNKTDKTALRQKIASSEQYLIQTTGDGLSLQNLSSFISISSAEATNIDTKISDAENALQSANSNSLLQTLPRLSQLPEIDCGIDFMKLSADLTETSETIQDLSLQSLFDSHCDDLSKNSIENPDAWLKKGTEYILSKVTKANESFPNSISCPFCKQSLDNTLEIIKAYNLRFNAKFDAFLKRLQEYHETIRAFSLDAFLSQIRNINQHNAERINSWKQHIGTIAEPLFDIIDDEIVLKIEVSKIQELLAKKLQNPSISLSITELSVFQSSVLKINNNVGSYNQTVFQYNTAITTFLSSILSGSNAQLEVNRLKRIKKRFAPSIISICNQFLLDKQNLATLETAYTTLVQRQESAASVFFSTYKDRINHYLNIIFKTPFLVNDVLHVRPAGMSMQSKMGYKLTIEGQEISFDHRNNLSVKDCLSEGDKSTIALAFFLAKLDIDPRLNEKIIVFDDPLSSFDSNRRMNTVQIIKNLFPLVKQIIVLSHNEYFLFELSKCFNSGDKKIFSLTENFTTKASKIEPLAIESLVENEYYKNIKHLETFLSSPDLTKKESILGLMRNILESHLRFKFYRQFIGIPTNGQTLGTLIQAIVNLNIVLRNDQNRNNIISKLSMINGVSCRTHHGEGMPDPTFGIVDSSNMTTSELVGFIRDTFNLIDNEI